MDRQLSIFSINKAVFGLKALFIAAGQIIPSYSMYRSVEQYAHSVLAYMQSAVPTAIAPKINGLYIPQFYGTINRLLNYAYPGRRDYSSFNFILHYLSSLTLAFAGTTLILALSRFFDLRNRFSAQKDLFIPVSIALTFCMACMNYVAVDCLLAVYGDEYWSALYTLCDQYYNFGLLSYLSQNEATAHCALPRIENHVTGEDCQDAVAEWLAMQPEASAPPATQTSFDLTANAVFGRLMWTVVSFGLCWCLDNRAQLGARLSQFFARPDSGAIGAKLGEDEKPFMSRRVPGANT